MKPFLFGVMLITLSLISPPSVSATQEGKAFPEKQFDHEKDRRFIICTGSAYACASETAGSEEKCLENALAAAKRLVLRKCHAMLEGQLTNATTPIPFEFVDIRPNEYVRVLEKKTLAPRIQGPKKSCGVQIMAEIRYRLIHSDSSQPRKLPAGAHFPLTARLWSDQSEYKAGEKIVFHLRGNRDFFTCIIDVAPDGEMIQLLPNLYRKYLFFKGGKDYHLPDPGLGDDFSLDVSPPFGEEHVLVYASTVPLIALTAEEYIGGFARVRQSEESLSRELRHALMTSSGKDILPGAFSAAEFFETRWTIRTHKRD